MLKLSGLPKVKRGDLPSPRAALFRLRKTVFGLEVDNGLLFKLLLYVVLVDIAYIYLNPLIYMVTTMVKNAADLMDPAVTWIPRTVYMGVLQEAWAKLDYPRAFLTSLALSGTIAILQTASCAVAGYAFARLNVPFKRFWFFCLLLTFIVPPQLTVLPKILVATKFGIFGSPIPFVLPAAFGLGLKGALFVIIYRQFFSTQPKELEEAAKMDGAGIFRVFYKVMLPLAKPAILVVFLFSFVWNWNDSYDPSVFMRGAEHLPLSVGITSMNESLKQEAELLGPSIYQDPIKMATAFLIILPTLVLYFFAQRWFVESVDRTGLVE
ncbi:MAG: binding-protein-dependent transport system inner rane component [Paenibacillaceae bacterium]|nr:binding-protein-dependent transport system inner rane component [Paenibacillaceae bacterium]